MLKRFHRWRNILWRALVWLYPPLLWDALAILGVLLIAGGLWWIYPPLGLIALGVMFIFIACLGADSWTKRRDKRSSKRRPDAS